LKNSMTRLSPVCRVKTIFEKSSKFNPETNILKG
jgi:hypothetical protein